MRKKQLHKKPGLLSARFLSAVLSVALFLGIAAAPALAAIEASPPSSETRSQKLSTGPTVPISGSSHSIHIETFTVEQGKTISIPVLDPFRVLVSSQTIAEVKEKRSSEIVVAGLNQGSTLIYLWERTGVRSLRISVVRRKEDLELEKESFEAVSPFYQNKRKKNLKFFYESAYGFTQKGKVWGSTTEDSKSYHHKGDFEGAIPWGETKGSLYYEYRRDVDLSNVAATMPRDAWVGLFDTRIPGLRKYDFVAGEHFESINRFGFPGMRYEGFTLTPSRERTEKPEKGALDFNLLAGRERDGGFLDSPGNIINRKTKDRVAGERAVYHLWESGLVGLGVFERWSGPKEGQSKKNLDWEYDLKHRGVQLKGEVGLSDARTTAQSHEMNYENKWFSIYNTWKNVQKSYITVSGAASGQGEIGYDFRTQFYPLTHFDENRDWFLYTDADFHRDRLTLNPDMPNNYIKDFSVGSGAFFPYEISWDISAAHRNHIASSFPYTETRYENQIQKSFWIHRKFLNQFRLFTTSTLDQFRNAVESEGYNADRFEMGGGARADLFWGFWASSKYLWDSLKEYDPPSVSSQGSPLPQHTTPSQLTMEVGHYHSFQKFPVSTNITLRHVDERQTFGKLHQPFLNEDRYEGEASINYRFRHIGEFYIEARASQTRDIIMPRQKQGEYSVVSGFRIKADTGVYWPGKGKIKGLFFNDANGNGNQDPGEPGIAGFEVWTNNNHPITSRGDGTFEFKIREGEITVHATRKLPHGFFFTTPTEKKIQVREEQIFPIAFGIASAMQVTGRVWLDVNENKIYDQGDIFMPGIRLTLDSGASATSSYDGIYSILRVPTGSNTVHLDLDSLPANYKTMTSIEQKFSGAPGDVFPFDVILKAVRSLSGEVYEDYNDNNIHDAGEPFIQGAVVTWQNKHATTNASGRYTFSKLTPGEDKLQLDPSSLKSGEELRTQPYSIVIPTQPFIGRNYNFAIHHKNPNPPQEPPKNNQ